MGYKDNVIEGEGQEAATAVGYNRYRGGSKTGLPDGEKTGRRDQTSFAVAIDIFHGRGGGYWMRSIAPRMEEVVKKEATNMRWRRLSDHMDGIDPTQRRKVAGRQTKWRNLDQKKLAHRLGM